MPIDRACLREAEARARAAYADPSRRYHDTSHVDDCLTQLDATSDLGERERRVLRWAILWHDAVYDATQGDNEERSAELAAAELGRCGADSGDIAEVVRMILLTKGHQVDEHDRLGSLLVSIDLSILGSDPERYRQYAAAVRDEYTHVPDETWRVGRSAVLSHLLAANPLYPDPAFRVRLEDKARRNLAAELSSLSAS